MGSSSAHRYQTKEINRLTGLVSYNYSTQSATPEDYIAMTRHILTKFSPKLLMLSFDFEVLNTLLSFDVTSILNAASTGLPSEVTLPFTK
jgi:hypothetical protein